MREEKAKDRREGLEEGNKVVRGVQSGGLGSPMLKFGGGGGEGPSTPCSPLPPITPPLIYLP